MVNMKGRKEAREFAMQAVFQMEAQKDFQEPDLQQYLQRDHLKEQEEYIKELLTVISANIAQIDSMLNQHSTGWPVSRMAKTDLAIARVAVGEMMYMKDVPRAVAINEAVDLAKKYGTDQSSKFINAILGKIE